MTQPITISPEVRAKYGNIKIAYAIISGVSVSTTPPRIKKIARAAEADVRRQYVQTSLENDPILEDWLRLSALMRLERDSEPAQLALMRRILGGKDIPKINAVVDIANICAAKFLSPVGVFDYDSLHPPIQLRLAHERDTITYIGATAPTEVPQDEIVYADAVRVFSRYCKDSDSTKITEATCNILCVVDGSNLVPLSRLNEARDYCLSLLRDVCGPSIVVETYSTSD